MKKSKETTKTDLDLSNPFVWIDEISSSKLDLIADNDNPERAEKDYNPYIVNKQFSYFIDTILYANEMNQVPNLDKLLQFHYYLKVIRPRKRYSKWVKKEKNESLRLVQEFFGYNIQKSRSALNILSEKEINEIKEKLEKGG